MLSQKNFLAGVATIVALLGSLTTTSMGSIVVTQNTNANSLATAVTSGNLGISVTSASLSGLSGGGAASSGTYSANGATYGLNGTGIVLSTGNVSDYGDGANTSSATTTNYGVTATAGQNALLSPITGQASHFDVTVLDIVFDLLPGYDTVYFDVVFGSEEYEEFVGSGFIDGFGLFVNGTNIASVGGFPVNINHPNMAVVAGTQLDGVLAPGGNPIVTFSLFLGLGATNQSLSFMIADAGDGSYDTTAYISSLGARDPGTVPEPGSLLVWGVGAFGLALSGLKRRR